MYHHKTLQYSYTITDHNYIMLWV